MDQEQITIELDDRPAAEAVKRANAGLESIENKTKTVVDGMGKQWAVHAETIVRISDRSKASIDRTIASVQKLADSYGKTEVEKLVATQDQLIQRFKGEQTVIDAVTSSYGKMIAAAKEAEAAKAKAAQQSAIDSYTREAALFQKTGVARLEAQRDVELGRYVGAEHEPVRAAIRQSYGSMIDVQQAKEAKDVIDKQKASLDSLISSLEREQAVAGKTGIKKEIAERELLLKEWQHEPKAVDAITASLKRLRAEEEQADKVHGNARRLLLGAKDLAEGYSRGAVIEGVDYLMSLRGGGAAGGAEAGFAGIAGLTTGGAIAIGSLAAAFGLLEVAGKEAKKSLGEFGQEVENIHLRTGLAVTEVQDFAYAAKSAGQDVSIFEKMVRGLSEAANENSREGDKARQTLQAIGVTLRDDTGALKPTGQVFREIAEGLNRLPEGFRRDAAALDLFKRAGIESIPVIEQLLDKLRESEKIGGTFSKEDFELFKKFREQTEQADAVWQRFKLRVEAPLAATVYVQMKFIGKAADEVSESSFMSALRGLAPRVAGPGEAGYVDPQTGKAITDQDLLLKDVLALNGKRTQHAEAAQERVEIDQAIRASQASQEKDLNFRLREAEQALGKLSRPKVGETSRADLDTYNAAFARVEQLKAAVKAAQKLREEEAKLQAFEKQMFEREGSYIHLPSDQAGRPLPVSPGQKSPAYFDQNPTAPNTISIFAPPSAADKIFAERDDLIKHGANPDRANAAALVGASAALAKDEQEWQKTWSETVRRGNEVIDKLRKEETQKAIESMNEATKQWLANLQRNTAALKEIDEHNFARMNAAEEHQERMLGLSAGPDEELKTLQAQLAMRERLRQAELAVMELHKGAFDLDKERFNAEMESLRDRYDFEERILELKKRQTDEVKQAVQPLVHTLLTKPGDLGKQLGDTLHAAALKPIEQGLTNIISQGIAPAIFGNDGQGGISGFFRSAFGGTQQYDQALLKGATDLNTMITAANTAAIVSQTEMWHQQQAFFAAQQQNAAAAASGQVGYTAASAPPLSAGATNVSGLPGLVMESLRIAGSGSSATTATAPALPQGTANSVIRFFTESGTTIPAEQAPAPAPKPEMKSPHGFPVLGDVASLDLKGIFGAADTNAYSDLANRYVAPVGTPSNFPLVTGTDATISPAPPAPAPAVAAPQQPSMWSKLLNGIGLGPGGTPGFTGPIAQNARSILTGGLSGVWGGIKNTLGQNVPTGVDANGNVWATFGNHSQEIAPGVAGALQKGVASPAVAVGGGMLMLNGLTGSRRGTWGGVAEATGGGALMGASIGMMLGGPVGALWGAGIGAAAGFVAGGLEKVFGVETPENEAKRLVKEIYGVKIDDGLAKQIVAIAQQKYASHVSMAVRAPEVRQLIMLYSEATGQKMPLSATVPRGASLVEQGGKLFQAPTYQDGTAYTFKSSLPVAGGYATGNYPSPSTVVLNVNGQSAADLLDGRVANTVSPSYVQDRFSQASSSSYGRLSNSAMMQQPGLIVS